MIRNATLKDINSIYELDKSVNTNNFWSLKHINDELSSQSSLVFVYVYGEEIVGFISSWIILDECHITNLVVDELFRRSYIADKLLYSLILKLRDLKVKWVTLEVRVSNFKAINLYKKYLFKQLGIRKKYYQNNNEDALILWSPNILCFEYYNYIFNLKR